MVRILRFGQLHRTRYKPARRERSVSAEQAKLKAAKAALRELEGCTVVGVGTGSTVEKLIELLPQLEGFREKLYVPSIDTALKLARMGLLVLDSFAPSIKVHVA